VDYTTATVLVAMLLLMAAVVGLGLGLLSRLKETQTAAAGWEQTAAAWEAVAEKQSKAEADQVSGLRDQLREEVLSHSAQRQRASAAEEALRSAETRLKASDALVGRLRQDLLTAEAFMAEAEKESKAADAKLQEQFAKLSLATGEINTLSALTAEIPTPLNSGIGLAAMVNAYDPVQRVRVKGGKLIGITRKGSEVSLK
jgi:hypothetical protein